jgi:hypothetical protein
MKAHCYNVTDSRGYEWTRTSKRDYTHVVVAHWGPAPATPFRAADPLPRSTAEWAGSRELASKAAKRVQSLAARSNYRPLINVEIVPIR